MTPVIVASVAGNAREPVTDLERDGVPMTLEPLEGVGRAFVVPVQGQEQLATCFGDGSVLRAVLAPVGMVDVANRGRCLGLPSGDEVARPISDSLSMMSHSKSRKVFFLRLGQRPAAGCGHDFVYP